MSAERWRDRVRKAWRDVDEARKWRQRVDDNDAEERVKGATENFWRALVGRPPMPPEVREALRRLDEFCEEHPYALDDDPILMERDQELQRQVTDAECVAGIHTSCRHRHQRRKPPGSPPPDDGEVSGDWFAEQRATTWGVIQPDGTVVAKGFLGDAGAQEDMAVHPPGAIAVHGAGGWTNAATGHPANEGPAQRADENPLPTEPETPVRPRDLPNALDQQRILDDHGPWTDDRATDAERNAARRFWDAVKGGDDTARNTAFAQYSDAKQARRDAANAAARAEALRETAAKRPETWGNLSTWSEEFLRESKERARTQAQSSNELEAGAARSFLAGAEYERRRRDEEADCADLRTALREMDDEDLEHEKRNTGELQEMAEDDGDTERAARLGRDYADFEAEQRRREEQEQQGSDNRQPWWYPADTSGLSFNEATDLARRAGDLADEHRRRGDPQDVIDRAERTYQQALQAQRDAGDRMDQRRREREDRQVCEPQKTTPPTGGTTTGSTGGEGTPDVHDRRVGRWYDDKPITSTNTASTGGSMASIDEARAAIMGGIEEENTALGSLQSAKASLEDAQNMLMQGTRGSNQSEADQAHAQLADAMSKIDEACQQVASTLQEFENVANRL